MLRQEVQANRQKAKSLLKSTEKYARKEQDMMTTASIRDQKREYDYIKLKNDVIIVEKDDNRMYGVNKVGAPNLARPWQL